MARLPAGLKILSGEPGILTASETVGSNSARLPSKMESWVQSWQPRTNAFCDFSSSTCLKVLRLPRKSDARSYEVLHLSRKIILANLKIWYSKTELLSGNHRPDLLTSLMNMSFVLRLPCETTTEPQREKLVRTWWCILGDFLGLRNVLRGTMLPARFRHPMLGPNVGSFGGQCGANIWRSQEWKIASHNGVQLLSLRSWGHSVPHRDLLDPL